MEWRLFLAALALIALVATLEAPPKKVLIEAVAPLYGGTGSPLDTGPWGTSLLYETLIREGYRVATSLLLYNPKPGEHVIIVAAWPRECNSGILPAVASAWKARGARVDLLVFSEDECRDALTAARMLVGANVTLGPFLAFRGLRAVPIAYPRAGLLAIGYTVRSISWTPLAACTPILVDPYSGSLVGILCRTRGSTLVWVADSHIPTNTLLSLKASRARRLIEALLEALGARDATVVLPVELYPRKDIQKIPLSLVIHPAVLAALIAKSLPASIERGMAALSAINPLLPYALYAVAAASLLALAAGAPQGSRVAEPEEPGETAEGGETREEG